MSAIFGKVIAGGPWALVVLIVIAWLAGDYGFLDSQSRKAVELIQEHQRTSAAAAETQKEILSVLKEQRAIQTQAALLACLRGAKTDTERQDCVTRYPLK